MRVVLKIMALPVIGILRFVNWMITVLTHVSAYVLSPLILFVLGCGIYCIFQAKWMDVAILSAIEVMILAVMFGAAWIGFLVEDLCENLNDYIHS
ncbi:MAG: hypothetical protein Q4B57_10375 [Eubacteriales bacterium]|nr:hypothetical protein [Eubacteriales bacterium]